jgi:hypothetical protein
MSEVRIMSAANGRVFDHVVIIMFENEYRSYVRDNAYMHALAGQGLDLATYFGVMHPSNTNYVASLAGEICNITVDPNFHTFLPAPPLPPPPSPLQQKTIVDLLVEKGLGWRAYMEGYQPVEFPPQLTPVMTQQTPPAVDMAASVKHTILDYPPYMNSHNAFVRFQSIMQNKDQWERIDSLYGFLRDALDGTLPEYSWISPHIWNDGHYLFGSYDEPDERGRVLVDQLAKWLQDFFSVLRFPGPASRLPPRTLVVVTFDESDFDGPEGGSYEGPNQVYTVLLGDTIQPGRIDNEGYNHYSLLKTIQQNFALGDLGKNDREANWLQFLWGRQFRWSVPADTPVTGASFVAAAGLEDALVVIHGTSEGVQSRTFSAGTWSAESLVPVPAGTSAVEVAVSGTELVLVCRSGGALSAVTYHASTGWSLPRTIVAQASGAFALTGYTDYGDQAEKVMLAWQSTNNAIQSQIYAAGTWCAPVAVGQQTDGDLVLASLGASLYLIHKAVGNDEMNVVSYNTADFNVVTGTPDSDNDTTRDAWSPSEFPVAHFGHKPGKPNPDPNVRPYPAVAPLAAATLDGVIHLAHAAAGDTQVSAERFSMSGVLTALKTFSSNTSGTGTSFGYGTLAEAGWTKQEPIAGVRNDAGGAMTMARFGSQVALLFQPRKDGALHMSLGKYV